MLDEQARSEGGGPMGDQTEPAWRKAGVGESFNIFQASVVMVSIFLGFVFTALLQLSLRPDTPPPLIYLLTLSMLALGFGLISFHVTAHQVLQHWGMFYPVSWANEVGGKVFTVGILLMYASVAFLLLAGGFIIPPLITIIGGVVTMKLANSMRKLESHGWYKTRVDKPLPVHEPEESQNREESEED